MSQRTRPGRVRALAVALAVALLLIHWAFTWADYIGLDFHVYRMGGQSVVDADGSLYSRSFGEGPGSLLFTYPPFAALLFTVFTLVSAEFGARAFVVLSILIAGVTSLYVTRYLGGFQSVRSLLAHPAAPAWAVAGTGAICLLGPWRETMAFSQVNIVLFAMISADLLSGRGRRFPTGLLTGVAAGIKLTPLVFGLYFLARGEWKQLFTMAGGFFGTIALGFLLLPSESLTYWSLMLRDTGRIGGEGYVDNLSVRGALLHFLGPDYPSTVPWLAISLLLVALTAFIVRESSRRGELVLPVAATAVLMLLISPISWSHHWVWIVVVLAVLAAQALRLPADLGVYRVVAAVLLAVTLLVFVYSPKTIGRLFGAEDLNSQLTTGWLMASSAGVFCAVGIVLYWTFLSLARRRTMPGRGVSAPAEPSPAVGQPMRPVDEQPTNDRRVDSLPMDGRRAGGRPRAGRRQEGDDVVLPENG